MLRLTITTGCFVMQAVSSAAFVSEHTSTIALLGGVAAGVATVVPSAWKFADRFFHGRECIQISQPTES